MEFKVSEKDQNSVKINYTFTDEELMVLNHLKEHDYMEFKNGGDVIVDDLIDKGFIKSKDMAWHYTVVLTDVGKAVVDFL